MKTAQLPISCYAQKAWSPPYLAPHWEVRQRRDGELRSHLLAEAPTLKEARAEARRILAGQAHQKSES